MWGGLDGPQLCKTNPISRGQNCRQTLSGKWVMGNVVQNGLYKANPISRGRASMRCPVIHDGKRPLGVFVKVVKVDEIGRAPLSRQVEEYVCFLHGQGVGESCLRI